jgi:hypothetical protein
MLDDLELPLVQELTVIERRVLAEHKPPAMDGSLLQNLGRRPSRLTLWGVATGSEAQKFVEDLEVKFRAGQPVPFTADIVADAELENVVIEDLRVQDLAGKPERFAYVISLREYIEPAEPEDTSLLDDSILDDAKSLVDDIVGGLDLGLNLPTGLEPFVNTFGDLLARLRKFREDIERARG